MGCMQRSKGTSPWFLHLEARTGLEGALGFSFGEMRMSPSFSADARTVCGTGDFHKISPIRWSSQMFSEKKSIPGEREGSPEVRALR